jgi:hypothetical protein
LARTDPNTAASKPENQVSFLQPARVYSDRSPGIFSFSGEYFFSIDIADKETRMNLLYENIVTDQYGKPHTRKKTSKRDWQSMAPLLAETIAPCVSEFQSPFNFCMLSN